MTNEQIAELERLRAEATKGEWHATYYCLPDGRKIETVEDVAETLAANARMSPLDELFGISAEVGKDVCMTGNGLTSEANSIWIAALHNAYPALRQRLLDAESRLAVAENALARAHGIAVRQLSEPADISDSIALVRICTEIEAAQRLREGK